MQSGSAAAVTTDPNLDLSGMWSDNGPFTDLIALLQNSDTDHKQVIVTGLRYPIPAGGYLCVRGTGGTTITVMNFVLELPETTV
jgi:hypothetical protein